MIINVPNMFDDFLIVVHLHAFKALNEYGLHGCSEMKERRSDKSFQHK